MYPERDMDIVRALDQTWDRLNVVSGNRLPDVEWYLTGGRTSACTVSWDSDPAVVRVNLQKGGVNRSGADILSEIVHTAAHAIIRHDPKLGAEGRYHGTTFEEAADTLGLEVVQPGTADYNTGSGRIPSQDQRKLASKYAAYVRRIDNALDAWEPEKARKDSRSPQAMRCRCTVDTILNGMEKRGVALTASGPPAAPKVINASSGVRIRGGIVCEDCGYPFE
jgi:hypothetical protein